MAFSVVGNSVEGFDGIIIKIPISDNQYYEQDITGQVRILEFFQSIYEPFVSGKMTVVDVSSTRVRKIFEGVLGQGEEIEFTLITFTDKKRIKIRDFCIYKVEPTILDNMVGMTNPSEMTTFYFCSKKMIENEFLKIRKTYTGKISQIVKKICDEYNFNLVECEETDKNYKITIPALNPVDSILWLSKFAQRKDNPNDVNYVFYEDINHKFYFKSIGKMLTSQPITPQNDSSGITVTNITMNESAFGSPNKYKLNAKRHLAKSINPLLNAMSGMYASTTLQFDITSKTYSKTVYSYDEKFDQMSHPENYTEKIVSESLETPFSKIYDHPEINVSLYPKCTYLYKNVNRGFRKGENAVSDRRLNGGAVQPPNQESPINFVHETVPLRASEMQALDQIGVLAELKGTTFVDLGDMIYFSRAQIDSRDIYTKGKRDKYFTGLYLVTNVKHTLFVNDTNKGLDLRTTVSLRKESEQNNE